MPDRHRGCRKIRFGAAPRASLRRLHREADGRFIGYAQWPDEESWRAFFDNPEPADPAASALFVDAMEAGPREPLMKLTVLDDMLVHP